MQGGRPNPAIHLVAGQDQFGVLALVMAPDRRRLREFPTGVVDPLKPLVPPALEGAPGWIDSARYTIDAKAEGPQSGAMMRGPLMQSLLEDRFQVKVHRQTREVSGYVMTIAKGGPKPSYIRKKAVAFTSIQQTLPRGPYLELSHGAAHPPWPEKARSWCMTCAA